MGIVPGGLLLWLGIQRAEPGERGWLYRGAAAVGVILGAGLTAAVIAAIVAVW